MTKYILILFCSLALTTVGLAQKDQILLTKEKEQAVEKLLLQWHKEGRFDGTALIAQHGQIFYKKAFGLANRSWNIPMTLEAKFDIASLNKSFAGVMALQMQESGLLDLQKTVADYLPEYKGAYADEMTLHQLLTHSSGLPDYDAIADSLQADNFNAFKRMAFTNEAYVRFISQLPRVGEPGKQFYYSNFAYHLLLMIMEEAGQKPYATLLQEYICQPAGMNNTLYPASRRTIMRHETEAYSQVQTEDSTYYLRNPYIGLSTGRRIYSTVEDLHRYVVALYDGTLLTPESLKQLTTNHVKQLNEQLSYGYGFVVHDGGNYGMGKIDIPYHYLIHGGSTDGYKAMLTIVEEGELIVTHLSNIGSQTNEMQLTTELLQLLTKNDTATVKK